MAEGPDPGRLRVGVPMLNYVPRGMGGTETYAREVLGRLASAPELELTSFLPRRGQRTLGEIGREVVVPAVNGGASTQARLRSMAVGALPWRRRLLAEMDLAFYPFTAPVPIPKGFPFVLTLHDVQHLDMPEFFPAAERLLRRFTYDMAARRADMVITVSEFCRSRIVERLGVASSRVSVVPLGVSEAFRPGREERQDFVLYPARRWPHKNHARLIEAMSLVRRQHPGLRLVLTGGGPDLDDVPDWVDQRGYVSEPDLADLYRRARCMVFPSLYEGFGMPPLEAMASGCPVASSSAGSLTEVCGDAAIMFDPYQPEAIAEGIVSAIDQVNELVARGIKRVRGFTWEACAAAHAQVFSAMKRDGGS
jgi:glycosyltransferase involved in cell wall biosynthesis